MNIGDTAAFRFNLRDPVLWNGQEAVVIARSYSTFVYSIRLADGHKHGVEESELQAVEERAA